MLPSRPVVPTGARDRDAASRSVLWVVGLAVSPRPPQGCFRLSRVPCVTLGVRAGRPREVTSACAPLPRRTTSSRAATVCCSAGSLRCSPSLGSHPGTVRPTTDLPQRCPRTAAGKVLEEEKQVLLCYKECQPGIPKLALICPKVTLSRVKTFWDGGPQRVHAA